jgi:hypothetical protein
MGNGKWKTEIFRERERGEAVLMSQGRAESTRFGIGGRNNNKRDDSFRSVT